MNCKLHPCVLSALWCSSPALAGIYEGNPGLTLGLSDAAAVIHAEARLDQLTLIGCDGGEVTLAVGEDVDLVQGFTVEVPRGAWCEVELSLSDLDLELDCAPISQPVAAEAVVVLSRSRFSTRAAGFQGLMLDREELVLRGVYEGGRPITGGLSPH